MKFWDSSAIVPLFVTERGSAELRALHTQDGEVVVWWATPVECAAALARLERDGRLDAQGTAAAFRALDGAASNWLQVEPIDAIRETARRLLRVHPLRTGDALQLAAAIMAAEGRPSTMTFVALDARLRDAAEKEGFRVLPTC
jgi:uncharacterized protein